METRVKVLVTGATGFIGDENASWDTFFATLRRYYPHHRVVRVPAALAEVGAALLEPVARQRRGPQLVTRDTVRSSTVRQPVRRGALWSDLGLTPRYSTNWWPIAGATPSTTA